MTMQEYDHERARRAEAFRREHLNEISKELRPEHSDSLFDYWECFAATGKIGDYLEFVRRREKQE